MNNNQHVAHVILRHDDLKQEPKLQDKDTHLEWTATQIPDRRQNFYKSTSKNIALHP